MASLEQLTPRSGRVKAARRLALRRHRHDSREFLAEGPQAVREAVRAGRALEVFATADASARYAEVLQAAAGVPWHVVGADVVDSICDTVQPQGLVARCEFTDVPMDTVLARHPQLVVVCADARDPGNAGSIIRTADAAGADSVVFAGNSVDPFNPKAVRASVGSHFHIDLVLVPDVETAVESLRDAGLTVVAADGTAPLDLVDAGRTGLLTRPTAWLFGNEAWGLPAEVRDLADVAVAIPIYGRAESLNLATAVAICLYASASAQRS